MTTRKRVKPPQIAQGRLPSAGSRLCQAIKFWQHSSISWADISKRRELDMITIQAWNITYMMVLFKDLELELDWRVWTVDLFMLKSIQAFWRNKNHNSWSYFELSWIDETSIVPILALELLHVDAQACLYHQSDHENARANFDKSGWLREVL